MTNSVKPAKHGRDHCPGGADPIPCLDNTPVYAYMFYDSFGSIATDSTTNITGYTSGVGTAGITRDLTNGKFELEQTGIYVVQLVTTWDNTFAGDKLASINTTGGNVLQDTNAWENWSSAQNLGTNLDIVTAEALIFVTSVSTDVLVQGKVRQTSGASRTLASVDFSVVRVSAYA